MPLTRIAPAWRRSDGFPAEYEVECDHDAQVPVFRYRRRAYTGGMVASWREGMPPAPPKGPSLWERLRVILVWVLVGYLVALSTAPASDGVRSAMSLRKCAPDCIF